MRSKSLLFVVIASILIIPSIVFSSPLDSFFNLTQNLPFGHSMSQQERLMKQHRHSHVPSKIEFIDTHSHLLGKNAKFGPAAESAIAQMNPLGVKTLIVMPPPQVIGQKGAYTASSLVKLNKKFGERIYFLGGGGSLNPIIYKAVKDDNVSEELIAKFKKNAQDLIDMGAKGFGELSALHLSLNPKHPYIEASPDHPLFLMLSDIAADAGGLPIDLHMEAVVEPYMLSKRYRSAPGTPEILKPNIDAFEKLLAHNRKTPIIWAHLGWDNTGYRTPEFTREMFKKHKNLYVSLRVVPETRNEPSVKENRLLDEHGELRMEWLDIIEDYPDRFLIGGDEFFQPPKMKKPHPSKGSVELTVNLLHKLTEDVAKRIAIENPKKLFKL